MHTFARNAAGAPTQQQTAESRVPPDHHGLLGLSPRDVAADKQGSSSDSDKGAPQVRQVGSSGPLARAQHLHQSSIRNVQVQYLS